MKFFPNGRDDRLEAGYGILTSFLMYLIGIDFRHLFPGKSAQITLLHDQTGGNGKYDPMILRAFNTQLAKKDFPYRDCFTTIGPMRWQQCVALQPADLIAFECFKQAEAKLAARRSRRSFEELLKLETFGIRSKSFPKVALLKLREEMEKAGLAMVPQV